MQPISGPGAPLPGDRPTIDARTGTTRPGTSTADGEQPLTPAQRTTLERLIVKIMSLSSLKSPELWAGLRHEVGVKNDAGLQAHHFPPAEQFLNTRLSQVQNTHATRQLLQQLTDLLPTGNNRQAVSDFIRQQFGHTVLSSLKPDQLNQVLTMLQNGKMAIPQPQQSSVTDRSLLPAEHQTLQQQISRLAAATGESPVKLWSSLLNVVNLHNGAPVPSRFFPLMNQYLQASQTLSQHPAHTLAQLTAALKQPPDAGELRMLEDYSQQRFNITSYTSQATASAPKPPAGAAEQQPDAGKQYVNTAPQMLLTPTQTQDLLNLLFSRRAERLQEQQLADNELDPRPIAVPLWGALPSVLQPLANRPVFAAFAVLFTLALVLWILL